VAAQIAALDGLPEDEEMLRAAEPNIGAIAFVHFDPPGIKSNMLEALVHPDDLDEIDRGRYVRILSVQDGRTYLGRIVEGPFFDLDALTRTSGPTTIVVLNQGRGKRLTLPDYHGRISIEILGERRDGRLIGASRRPRPGSPAHAYASDEMSEMLGFRGGIVIGMLDTYEDVLVRLDEEDKAVLPRHTLTVGTTGSGKTNTSQAEIEELVAAGWSVIAVDVEPDYILMDQPSDQPGIDEALAPYGRAPRGVPDLHVYTPGTAERKRSDAIRFSVPFDSLPAEIISELVEMTQAQEMRFNQLYLQAIRVLRKRNRSSAVSEIGAHEDFEISRGYPGMTLQLLLDILREELDYYEWKKAHPPKKATKRTVKGEESETETLDDEPEEKMEIYRHEYKLEALVNDAQDVSSYGALRKKLADLALTRIFDRKGTQPLDMGQLCEPGRLSVIDVSDVSDAEVVNIVIADLLSRLYRYKNDLSEDENVRRKVMVVIEEAHNFVSRDRQDRMAQTLDQLTRIARRGRKRWLALNFVTQSPAHLPHELFELATNKIIHQTTGDENIRALKKATSAINEGIWSDLPSFGSGRAVIVSSQFQHPIVAQIRPAASRRNHIK
jgi:DNA helicase HerA-like ATPase